MSSSGRSYASRGGRSGTGRGGRGDRGGGRGSSGGDSRGGRGDRGGGRGAASAGPRIFQPSDGGRPILDKAVEELEGKLASSAGRGSIDLSKLALSQQYPYRPGYGTRGVPVILWTNYFRVMFDREVSLFRYSIEIDPQVQNRRLRARIITVFLSDSPISAVSPGLATDYQANVIAVRRLTTEEMDTTIDYRDEVEQVAAANAKRYRLRLQEVAVHGLAELFDYVTSSNVSAALTSKDELIQALNIIFGHFSKSKDPRTSVSTRQNVHYTVESPSAEGWDLGGGLKAWRGYFTSVRTAAARLLVNVQIKHTSMYKAVRLDALIDEFRQQNGGDMTKLNKFLRGVRIDRIHLRGANRTRSSRPKTIIGLANPRDGRQLPKPPKVSSIGAAAKQVQFYLNENAPQPLRPNTYVTVFEYFNRVYNIQANATMPIVNVGSGDSPNHLPSEACFVLPAQITAGKLNADQTAQMIRFAVRPPFDNSRSINDSGLVEIGLKSTNPAMTAFGLQLNPQMLIVQARILPVPSVKYGGNSAVNPRFGSWNMGNSSFTRGATLDKWSVLWLRSQNHRDPWDNDPNGLVVTLKNFHATLNNCGLKCSPPLLPGKNIDVDRGSDELAIESGLKELMSRKRNEKLLLVILPRRDDGIYNLIKRLGDVDFGIHTVCVVASKFAKPNNVQYFANVALKINLKLGGVNQTLDANKLGIIAQGKTMVVGLDVTHPSPGSDERAPSVAAMVASIDKNLGQFPAVLYAQKSRQEMVSANVEMLKSRFRLWQKYNANQLPENILVYRDGVSEGQYSIVLDRELPLLRQACRETYSAKSKQPSIAIIVVGKRHSTRFYPTSTDSDKIDERSSNPKNGTVVDRGITEPRYWDFYLQAHTALQGTARPAHYFVIHDEIFARNPIPPGFAQASDVLEDLTHNLCYMFGRATKSVSYCPPAYYADMVCERARCYLSNLFSPNTSQAGSATGEAVASDENRAVSVHDAIKDSMFYI